MKAPNCPYENKAEPHSALHRYATAYRSLLLGAILACLAQAVKIALICACHRGHFLLHQLADRLVAGLLHVPVRIRHVSRQRRHIHVALVHRLLLDELTVAMRPNARF